ncbi:Cytochrome c oxidase subunit 6A1, mitochondrial [Microtus ochrogaster]|uniref:Cytochrome c oxidase subunit 6A1, mitochondrial n=1 Tax=Microtus ochrogaster TaxID=79684 RepID=A0A8J6GUA5_MICOH|nr:Cytochrome c oxidase subunit 6A1, mitochondrial [Microtus ochrogaster]
MVSSVFGSRVSGLLSRALPRVGRPMSSGAHGEEGSARMWKALTYFVALPGVGVSMLNVFLKSQHGEHERPEFVAYPHLRIRTKELSKAVSYFANLGRQQQGLTLLCLDPFQSSSSREGKAVLTNCAHE